MLSRHHRIALVSAEPASVFVVGPDDRPLLPGTDQRWPALAELLAVVGDPRAILIGPPARGDDGTVVHVFLASERPSRGGWLALTELERLGASNATRDSIRTAVREWEAGSAPDGRAEWFVRGWYARVERWVAEMIEPSGCAVTGSPIPVKVWSLSAVLRFRVRAADGAERDVWFKATCDGFHDEAAVTAVIADMAPHLSPRLIAVDAERAWMLMEQFSEGDDVVDLALAERVAAEIAGVQLATSDRIAVLVAAGAPDRGAEPTIRGLRRVISSSIEAPLMPDGLRARAEAIEQWLVDRVHELYGLGFPRVLDHGDLHLGNIGYDGDRPVVFDWTDACLAHPYLDARHLANNAARDLVTDLDAESIRRAVWQAFSAPWRAAYPHLDHERAWALTAIVENVFTAVSYEQIARAQPEGSRWELGGMVGDLLGRLIEIHDAIQGEGIPRLES